MGKGKSTTKIIDEKEKKNKWQGRTLINTTVNSFRERARTVYNSSYKTIIMETGENGTEGMIEIELGQFEN